MYVFNCNLFHCASHLDINSRSRRERFSDWVRSVSKQTAGEAAVVLDELREVGDWKSFFVETVGRWAVIGLGEWIVENNGVGSIVSTNYNTVQ